MLRKLSVSKNKAFWQRKGFKKFDKIVPTAAVRFLAYSEDHSAIRQSAEFVFVAKPLHFFHRTHSEIPRRF